MTTGLAEKRALCFDSGDEDTKVHFAFDHARPGVGIGSGLEGLALGWIALAADLHFPLILAAIPDCCHSYHPRHNNCGKFVAKTTFRPRTGFR